MGRPAKADSHTDAVLKRLEALEQHAPGSRAYRLVSCHVTCFA
jgi:hypothetical protein